MFWKRFRFATLAGALLMAAGLVMADDKKPAADKDKVPEKVAAPSDKPKDKVPEKAPMTDKVMEVAPPPASHCGSGAANCGHGHGGACTTTVWVDEWVPETYQTTRTVNRMESRTENYTAYRTEQVPETRTRQVTKYRNVTETVMETRTKTISVPVTETKTVMRQRTVCRQVTVMESKCEDHGHYECQEVPCGPSLLDRLRSHRSRKCSSSCDPCGDSCDPCPPVRTKTVKVWVPCMVTVQKPVCKTEKHTECYPETITVTSCRKECVTEQVPVCRTRCVPEVCEETYTCMVSRCVPYQACRTVQVCVPHTETVTCTRMVCRKVAKEVAVSTSCGDSCGGCGSSCGSSCGHSCDSCCSTPCCSTGCHSKRRFFHGK